jgi:hypothetical protein
MFARLLGPLSLTACVACGGVVPEPPATGRSDGCEAPHPEQGHSFEVYLAVKEAGRRRAFCPG